MSDVTNENVEQQPDEVEQEARDLGWVPEDEFRGPKERWVDAQTFVEKGRHILPIMKENINRLKSDLLTRDKKIATLQETVDNSNKAIEALEKHFTAATKRQVTEAKKALIEQIKVARESGDVDGEMELLEQLDSVKSDEAAATAAQKKKEETPSKKDDNSQYLTPDIIQWGKDNPWYETDAKLRKAMDRTCEDLREAGDTSMGVEFLEKAHVMMKKRLEYIKGFDEIDKTSRTSKVEGGAPGRGTSNGGGSKSFASLPADAKKACHEDKEILVGANKRYKTLKEWEDAYAKMYYSEE
jgi:hypothetical protein